MQLKASAPGSLMLLGEYAVLHGKHALVCAVDKRVTVILTPRTDNKIEIHSDIYGDYSTDLIELKIEKPFHFILNTLKLYQGRLRRGCNIEISSEFSDQIGLGSSAAVIVATIAALITWLDLRMSPLDLVRQGRNVVRQVQGIGSGADIAASVYGGIVGYQAQPLFAEKFSTMYPLTALYAGFKTTTIEAIQRVQHYFSDHTHLFRQISNSIGQCALEGIQVLGKQDWAKLGTIMNIQQGMMESLGVSTPLLRHMVDDLLKQKTILGAKISGSGFGDCVIGLGDLPIDYSYTHKDQGAKAVQRIPVTMSLQGVLCEKV